MRTFTTTWQTRDLWRIQWMSWFWTDFSLVQASCSESSAHTVMLSWGHRNSHSTPLTAIIPRFSSILEVGVYGPCSPLAGCPQSGRRKTQLFHGYLWWSSLWEWFVDRTYLELEITLSQEQIQKYTDCLQFYVNNTLKELRRLFLVQDLVDSLKVRLLKPFTWQPWVLFSLMV